MSQTTPATVPNGEKRHVRPVTRIAPVIPRQYSKKKSVDKGPVKPSGPAGVEATPSAVAPNGSAVVTYPSNGTNGGIVTVQTHETSPSDTRLGTGERNGQTLLEYTEEPTPTARTVEPAIKFVPVPIPEGSAKDTASETTSAITDSLSRSTPSSSTSKSESSRVPAHLPPEFYPSSHPSSSGKDAASKKTFVFGGHVDSSSPSPVPPTSSGSWTSGSGLEQPREDTFSPPPSQFNNEFSRVSGYQERSNNIHPANGQAYGYLPPADGHRDHTNNVNGHRHHASRHTASRSILSPRSESFSSIPSEQRVILPFQNPSFFPQTQAYAGGYSIDSATNYYRQQPFTPYHPQRGSGQFDAWSGPTIEDHSLQALRVHIESMFGQSAFSDCVLRLPGAVDFPAHRFILSRSPRLNSLLRMPGADNITVEGRECTLITIPTNTMFGDSDASLRAVRSLYGSSSLRHSDLSPFLHSPQQVMSYVLSYAATCIFLEIHEVASSSLHLATELLLPENIPIALAFAIPSDQQQDHVRAEFLPRLTHFLAWHLSTGSFDFDATVPELQAPVRIPVALQHQPDVLSQHASRPSIPNRKLQGIQLGDFGPHQSAVRTLSSALLSLPSQVLQTVVSERVLAERLSPSDRKTLVGKVVAERERRRLGALDMWRARSSKTEGRKQFDVSDATLREVLGGEESVEDEEDGRVGIVVRSVTFER